MNHKPIFLIVLVFLAYALLLTPLGHYQLPLSEDHNPGYYSIRQIDPGDDSGYLAYLRSAVIDGDYDFFNEKGFWHFDAVVDTGYTANYWYIGAPMLWTPFFLFGHGLTGLLDVAGMDVAQDGYSFPYLLLTHVGSSLLTLAGLLVCYISLLRLYQQRTAFWTTLACFAGTCLPYFTFIRNRMSHSGDVLAGFLFLYFFLLARSRPDRPLWFYALWGLLLGFLIDLRYINIVYAILPAGHLLQQGIKNQETGRSFCWKALACGFAGMILGALPQWTFWLGIHGQFSSLNPFPVQLKPTPAGLFHSVSLLFNGGTRGLLGMEWIWLPALAGVALILYRDRWLGSMLLLVFLGFCVPPLVIIDPATFGQRYLLPALPVLALGLGRVFSIFQENQKFRIAQLLSVCAAGWMYYLTLHYKVILPHNDPEFLKQAFENLPQLFSGLAWLRPTTLFDLGLTHEWQLQNARDWIYLIGWPLGLAALALLTVFLVPRILEGLENHSPRILKTGLALAVFCLTLSGWTLWNHPPLEAPQMAERFRMAAVSRWLKSPAQMEQPMAFLQRSNTLVGDTEEEMLIRGDFIFMQGDWKRAKGWYQKAVDRNPNSMAQVQLERIHLIQQLSAGTRIKPSSSLLLNSLWQALILLDNKHAERALTYLDQALNLDPNSPYSEGIREMIRQLVQQRERLKRKSIPLDKVPPVYLTMAGTRVNAIRMTLPLFDGYI